jgi:hypothetical protein
MFEASIRRDPDSKGPTVQASVLVATAACGLFFLTALLTGVWKWRGMLNAPDHLAPHYVDTAHRAALLYSFACLVLIHFAELSPFPEWVNVAAVSFPLVFFAVAILTYVQLGLRDTTDNAFEQRDFGTTTGVAVLAVSEIGGFAVLLAGFVLSQLG